MAPANVENKKGKKNGGTRNSQTDSDGENLLSVEIEIQIQGEIEKAQDGESFSKNISDLEDAEDVSVQSGTTMSANSKFDFVGPRVLPPMTDSERSNREPVTPTKFSEYPSFLKRSINDLSFTPERIARKNLRLSKRHDNSLLAQILSKLSSLSDIVDSQTAHIIALEKRIEELTTHSKENTQINKASQSAIKKIETMADRVAAMAATSSATQSNPANVGSGFQTKIKPGPNSPDSVSKKTSPYLAIDLLECTPSLNERPLKEIRQHLQASIKGSDRDIRAMSRDKRKDHRYFLSIASQAHENTLRVHLDECLFQSFPKAQVQATILYPIRVDSVNANTILDAITGHVSPQAASSIGEENGSLSMGRIGWLSQPGKKYGSIVLYLKEKSQADAMIARGFMEVGGESGITQVSEKRGKAE